MLKRLVPLLVLIAGVALLAFPSDGAPVTYTVTLDTLGGFTPAKTLVNQGDTVKWKNNDSLHQQHTVTSLQNFWPSRTLNPGTAFSLTNPFLNAGTYRYHCTIHSNMTGKVLVKLKKAGTAANGYTVTWSSATTVPADRNFDVQINLPGTATGWEPLGAFTGTTAQKTKITESNPGTYQVRSRTNIVSSSAHSDWSPVLKLTF